MRFTQIAELVRRATMDGSPGRGRSAEVNIDGPAREERNDRALLAAGIGPGHPSLYPTDLRQVFPRRRAHDEDGPTTNGTSR